MSAELSDGQTFGGYHIAELVGSGGMGLVYRAEQRILGRTVALKVIRPEIAESGDYRARFLREARFAAAVDHPHVVSVFDAGEQDGRLYLAMQWVDGLDLATLIEPLAVAMHSLRFASVGAVGGKRFGTSAGARAPGHSPPVSAKRMASGRIPRRAISTRTAVELTPTP